MGQDDSTNRLPPGLHFYWYERKAGEEHPWSWGQLCGSMHRLAFVADELARNVRISDMELALARLAYNMENYLSRIYELRERAARLLIVSAGRCVTGKNGQRILKDVKGKRERRVAVRWLSIDQQVQTTYLQLLSLIDDDIHLRRAIVKCCG